MELQRYQQLKETIVKEIDSLSKEYYDQVTLLNEKIKNEQNLSKSLEGKLTFAKGNPTELEHGNRILSTEVSILLDILLETNNQQYLSKYFTKYRKQFGRNWWEKVIELVSQYQQRENYQYVMNIIKAVHDSIPHINVEQIDYPMVYELGVDTLIDCEDHGSFDYVQVRIAVMQLLRLLGEKDYHTIIRDFFHKNAQMFREIVFLANDTTLIIEMIRCYITYDLMSMCEELIDNLIEEWPFWGSAFTDREIGFLLLASLMVKKDQPLLDVANLYLNNDDSLQALYIGIYDIINSRKDKNKKIDNLKQVIQQSKYLPVVGKQYLNKMLESHLVKNEADLNSNKEPIREKEEGNKISLEQILALPGGITHHPNEQERLKNVKVRLALYPHNHARNVVEYVHVFAKKAKTSDYYYLTEGQLDLLGEKRNGFWIHLGLVDKALNLVEMKYVQLTKNKHKQLALSFFKWPTTTIQKRPDIKHEKVELNGRSRLRTLGYQITGMSRSSRWKVLEKQAVPELGLKFVANTIAYLVRGRKLMKNGLVRNRHAIEEWEHDLERLRDTFYQGDFKWPSIKR